MRWRGNETGDDDSELSSDKEGGIVGKRHAVQFQRKTYSML